MSPRPAPAAGGPRETQTRVRIGPRLRAARRARGLTIGQVADDAGLTKGFVSRLERDDVSPSVASLVRVCEVLKLRVGALFDPPDTSLIRAGEGRPVNVGGHDTHERVVTPGTQQHIEIIHSVIEGGGGVGDALYSLDCDAECVYVLAGRLEMTFEGRTETLGKGDAMTFPGKAPHAWRNASPNRTCEVLWALAPAP